MTEKELARTADVQFTPTLLFFDEQGEVVARLNGYYPPHLFERRARLFSGRGRPGEPLAAYLTAPQRQPAATAARRAVLRAPPHDLARRRDGRPAAVLFETVSCARATSCIARGSGAADVRKLLAKFDVARVRAGRRPPRRRRRTAGSRPRGWAAELRVATTPTMVFFDDSGTEVFRIDAYLRPFHLASSLDYVASGSYRAEPSFQRFIQPRDPIRADGKRGLVAVA